jgi:two-component system phosphate regulon sensor histidine kinase PhoR
VGSLSGRIFRNIFLTAVVVVLLADVFVAGLAYAMLDEQMRRELLNTVDVIEEALAPINKAADNGGDAAGLAGGDAAGRAGGDAAGRVDAAAEASYLARLELRDIRVTWIASDGSVLHDSAVEQNAVLENHLNRPEVLDALRSGSGTASRQSETLGEETVYLARLLPDGTILRVAGTQKSVLGHLGSMLVPLILVLGAVAVVAALIARFTSRRILKPLADIDFEQPLENETYPELSPLLTRLNTAHRELAERNAQLDAREREFAVVTDSMKEGLVLADAQGRVLFINTAAARLFDSSSDEVVGRHLLALNRSATVQEAVDEALGGRRMEKNFELDNRVYQVLANPVFAEGEPSGAAFLVLDITEWYLADVQRREFTANVTHELKTPLTVINGYAELIEKGMAKPEDVGRFSGLIHDEAGRLITLIDDIITLSQLDEQKGSTDGAAAFEEVDLFALAQEVTERLGNFAQERGVALALLPEPPEPTVLPESPVSPESPGCDAGVLGIQTLLYRMLYNLVENGIRYTEAGGEVSVTVVCDREDGRVVVRISDSGIGIPEAFHEKVFERFFCVDSSRSRETGGTGLGLAIVKHGALLHNATITLQSTEGFGTTIELSFPHN